MGEEERVLTEEEDRDNGGNVSDKGRRGNWKKGRE